MRFLFKTSHTKDIIVNAPFDLCVIRIEECEVKSYENIITGEVTRKVLSYVIKVDIGSQTYVLPYKISGDTAIKFINAVNNSNAANKLEFGVDFWMRKEMK